MVCCQGLSGVGNLSVHPGGPGANPLESSIFPHALALDDALRLLDLTTKHSGHQFWSDSLSVHEAGSHAQGRVVGHQQITDAYLIGLALRNKGKLATLDQRIYALAPIGSPQHSILELIGQ